MKHKLIILSLTIVTAFLVSFKKPEPAAFTGTYGICNQSTPMFELKINNDHTFSYLNNMDPANKIAANGVWEEKGKTIVLKDYQPNATIATKWKVDKTGQCISGRVGMNFIRLCKTTCN
jgi:hypothetical protein